MDTVVEDVDTDVIDLQNLNIADLLSLDADDLALSVERILQQIEKPRTNLGGSGPPGRTD